MGLELLSFIIISLVLFVVQLGLFLSLPYRLQAFIAGNVLLGTSINWTFSGLILHFTGAGTFVGLCNLCGSLFLAVALWAYKHMKGIKEVKIVIKRIFPTVVIVYTDGTEG